MFSLIRFFERQEYMEEFLDGKLYMNSLGHFWKIGQPNPQDDLAEGLVSTMSSVDVDRQFGTKYTEAFGNHILAPFMNRAEGFQYVHVLCFFMHEYDANARKALRVPESMKNFGQYAICIKNMEEFTNRLFQKIKGNNQYGLMGPITYHPMNEILEYEDCFDKSNVHRNEQEWRFALIPDFEEAKKIAADRKAKLNEMLMKNEHDIDLINGYDNHVYFEVGDLRDIADVIDVRSFINDPGSVYSDKSGRYRTVDKLPYTKEQRKKELDSMRNAGIPLSYDVYPYQYIGWAPREAFKDIVLQIDDTIKPIMILG